MNNRQYIIDATVDIIKHYGFSNFSIGKVANKINISKGVITYHFPTKESLLQSVVANYYDSAASYMEQHIRLDKGSIDTLNSYIESCIYFSNENKEHTVAIVDIILNSRTDDGKALFAEGDNSIYQPLIEIFKYGQETEKVFRNFSPEFMARCVRSIIDSISLAVAKEDIKNIEDAVREVETIFELATKL